MRFIVSAGECRRRNYDKRQRIQPPFTQYYNAALADGSITRLDVYGATVLWDGVEREVRVIATGVEPLLGMSLLNGFEVCLQAVDGGIITIESL